MKRLTAHGPFFLTLAALTVPGAALLHAQPPSPAVPTAEERFEAKAAETFAASNSTLQVAKVMAGTLVSEDLTCITVGLLIRKQLLDPRVGFAGCFLGILLGDFALWAFGRLVGYRALRWKRITRWISPRKVEQMEGWFAHRGWTAVLAARFLPGTRMPVYFMAGAVGHHAGQFLLCAFIAAVFWTPLLIVLVILFGHQVAHPLEALFGSGIVALLASAVCIMLIIRVISMMVTPIGRARLTASVSRLWRWEFWPQWFFYLPVLPWIAWLALRHRGLTVPTAANPGIPHGGIVGESKFDILRQLPAEAVVPSALIHSGPVTDRVRELTRLMHANHWHFPVILKPDAGQRGAGLRRISNVEEAAIYFQGYAPAILVQTYHPGPFEAGVFYYRMPDETTGRIFSITDKHFPRLVGDGVSTVEALIWRHPRFRMQARTFLTRLDVLTESVPDQGETLSLAVAGNHCQGTLFRDGSHLITPALERRIDAIAREFPGFYFGRFDIRYTDVDAFQRGEDVGIVELNGIFSESTNIYDPSWRLWSAYRVLYRQWSIVFAIGAANRRRGHRVPGWREVWRDVRAFYKSPRPQALSD